jgi:uncharacterized protein (TIGR03083 family)
VITDLAEAETLRMADALAALDHDDWSKQTDCPKWTVRDVAGHVVGMTRTFTALPQFARDMVASTRAKGDGLQVDALTARQVEHNAALSPDELIAELRALAPRNAAWRRSRRLMRNIPLKNEMRDGTVETWKFAYLVDTILTRDTWMHRVDIAEATGRPMTLTADHDGRIVADVVAEWARRHGQPFTLRLRGPAGGEFSHGTGGDDLQLDAIQFCRILSGRGEGTGLLTQEVPF